VAESILVGLYLDPEDCEKLAQLSRSLGWSKSKTVREMVKSATVSHLPTVTVTLPGREGAGHD
jgi:hypothetical protein